MNADLPRVLITGGAGYIGQAVARRLAEQAGQYAVIVVVDVRAVDRDNQIAGVQYESCDVRNPAIQQLIIRYKINTVVHLASIVNPGGPKHREIEYSIDVLGTKNVLDACVHAGVSQLVLASSGAAYGYHADNPIPLHEHHPLRGNTTFPYSDHKRQVEEILKEYRRAHPQLLQLIFRPCTVLGQQTRNSITALLDRRRLLGLCGHDIPFVFVWDQDVADCIVQGIMNRSQGIYNLAGDGVLTMKQIAQIMNKPMLRIPPWLLGLILRVLQILRLSRFGPEHVDFLRYRPVLANDRLKQEFGYTPKKSTLEVLQYYMHARQNQ